MINVGDVNFFQYRATRVLVLGRARRCALEACEEKKNVRSTFRPG